MFGAVARWFKAIGYLLTGQVDAARKTLDTNPHVIRAKFDEIAREKTEALRKRLREIETMGLDATDTSTGPRAIAKARQVLNAL